MRRRKQRKKLIIILCFLLLLMTVAYATFQTKIKVVGNTKITSNWDIRITNVTEVNKTGSGESTNAPLWTNLTAYMEADLYEKGDSVEYDVTIENKGTLDAQLEDIISNVKSNNEAVKISFSGYAKGEKLFKNTKKSIKVKIEYNPDFNGKAEGSGEVEVSFDYGQAEGGTITPSKDTYLLTYDYKTNGGTDTAVYDEYVEQGQEISLGYSPVKVGYEFIGWNTDKDAMIGLESYQMPNQATTLYAIYRKKVTVNYEKSSAVESINRNSDTCYLYNNDKTCEITLPTITANTGYTVSGWYNGETKVGNANAKYNASTNVNLVAKASVNSYDVTYNYSSNGGTSSTKTSAKINYNESVDLTPKATKDGWTFVGWNTNKNATTGLSALKMGTSDITLYAIYKKEAKTITITFNKNGAASQTVKGGSASTATTVTQSCTIPAVYNNNVQATTCNVTSPTIIGSTNTPTVVGYNTSSTATTSAWSHNTEKAVSSNATYYAITSKSAKTITITFNKNGAASQTVKGGSASTATTVTQSCTIPAVYNNNVQATTCNVTSPTIIGSTNTPTVVGYNTSSTATTSAWNHNIEKAVSSNATYYAVTSRAAKTITINYSKESSISTIGTTSNSCTIAATYNGKAQDTSCEITLPTITANTGYTVSGWYNGETKVGNANAKYNASTNVNLVAKASVNSYDVTYNYSSNGGTSSTKTSAKINYNESVDLTPKATKDGWTFVGWNTDKDAHTSISTLKMPDHDVTLYAIYRKSSKTLTATFNGNGALAGDSNKTCEIKEVYNNEVQGSSCTITLPSITRIGFTIHGWNTDKDSTSGTAVGTSVSINANTTYYAITSKAVTVTFNRNNATSITPKGGSASTAASLTQSCTIKNSQTNCNITSPSIAAPSNTPTVVGWSDSANTHSNQWSVNTAKAFSDNATYYAQTTKGSVTKTATFTVQDTNAVTASATTASCTIAATWNNTAQGTTCTAKAPALTAKTGYTAIGWNTNKSAAISILNSGADVTLNSNTTYYSITKNNTNLTATFNGNGATAGAATLSCTRYNGASSCNVSLPSITRSGFTVHGWNTNKDATSGTAVGTSVSLSANATYYAITSKEVTATFSKGSNVSAIGSTSGSCTIRNSATTCAITTPTITANTGYTSVGWSTTNGASSGTAAGSNVSISANTTYYANALDKTAPTKPSITNSSNGNWSNADVVVTVTSTDAGSGIDHYEWYENGAWTTRALTTTNGKGTITYTADRNETFKFRAIDKAGNISAENTTVVKIDKSSPTLSVSTSKTTNSITVNATASAASGISKYEYSIDGGSTWVKGDGNSHKFTGLTAGKAYTIKVRVTNGAGTVKTSDNISVTTNTLTKATFSESGSTSKTVKITYPDGCGTTYVCTYSKDGSTAVNVTTKTVDVSFTNSGSLSATVSDKTNSVNSNYTVKVGRTVTYNYSTNGGTAASQSSAIVEEGKAISLSPTATKSGWTFVGWNTNKDATSAITSLNMGTSNVTLYAIFRKEAKTVTITFNRNNAASLTPKSGSASTATSLTQSCTIPAVYNNATQATTCNITSPSIAAPTNTPTVVGFNTSSTGTSSQWNHNTSKAVSSDATYYAITTKGSVTKTATFTVQDTNAATASATTASCTIPATYNGAAQGTTCTAKAPTLTAKTGYTAIGWNTNKSAAISTLNSGADVTLNSNTTYYSITKNNTNLTATFNGNGATAGVATLSCTRYNGATSCNVSLPSITRSGFTVHGWNTNKDATSGTAVGTSVSLSANATYYAITSKEVTITFNRNNATSITPSGGSASTAASLTQSCTIKNSQTTCNITSPAITAPSNTPTVIGWSDSANTHSNQWSVNTAKGVSANTTYYAQTTKTAVTKTATFTVQDTNAVTASATTASCTIAATWNNTAQGTTCTAKAPTLTAKTGYTAIGWNTNKAATTSSLNSGANVTLNSNTTYYSITKNNTNLTSTFTLQDTNAATTSATSASCTKYNGATSCSVTAPTLTAKTGYTAYGWNTNRAATTSSLNSGANVTLNSNATYYSITRNNTALTATFNGNGATSGSASGNCYRFNGASSCAVKSPSITRSGFTIHGWNTNKDATSGTAAESNLSLSANTTYYAITSKAVTVTFNRNNATSITPSGGSASTAASLTQSCTIRNSQTTCNITSPSITAPSNTPTVIGWSTAAGTNSNQWSVNTAKAFSANATYYAQTTKAAITRTATFNVQDTNAATTSSTSASCTIAATWNNTAQGTTCTAKAPTLTAKTGYTAIGWNTNKSATTSGLNSGADVTLNSNVTYYSITKNNTNLTATFNGNGATAGSSSASCTRYNGASSCNVSLPSITRNGFTIHGWNTNKDATSGTAVGTSVSISANSTYYAITSKAVTVTFNRNNATSITPSGGSASTAASLTQSCTIKNSQTNCNITSPSITAPSNTPTVIGWSTASGTNSNQWSVNTAKAFSDNATYYAQTTKAAVTRTATFNVQDTNAATTSSTTASCTIAATWNNTVQGTTCTAKAPTLTAKTGYTAIGWNTNKAATTSGLNSGANVTLSSNATYYSITKNNTNLTGTFSLQDTNAATASATSVSCTKYNGATSCSITAPTLTAKTGYTAIGWNTNKSATTSGLNSGANVTLSSNTTYYSITKNNTNLTGTFTVQDTNAATTSATSASCTKYNGATSCSIKAPTLTAKTGYTAIGWNTNKAATTSSLNSGANATLSSNTTYYSITKNNTNLTVTFNGNGSAAGNNSVSCTKYNGASSCSVKLQTITRSGFTVHGWNTNKDATSGTAAGTIVSISANTTYYAITSKAVTVTFSKGANVSAIGSTSGSCTIRNSATTCAVTTPTITANTGYTSVGWSTTNGASSGTAAGSNVSISANTTYYANALDKTAPSISFNPNTQTSYTNGTAVVLTIADSGSGVKPGQNIYYAWSTSPTSEPAFSKYLTIPSASSCPSGYVEIGGVCYLEKDASTERACLSSTFEWDSTLKVCYDPSNTTNKTSSSASKSLTLTVPVSASNNLTGTYYLWIKSGINDVAGNVSSSKVSSSFKFDATAPTLSFTTAKTTKSITVTATASATSGIKKYEYSKDGGSTWVTGTGNTYTFGSLTHNTAYNIKVRVTSNSGKVTTADAKSVTTDKLALPTFTETNEGEVTVTYPSGCASPYTCSYNKGSDVTVTSNPVVYLGTDGNIIAKVTDGTNTVTSTYTVTRKNFYVSSSGSDTSGFGTINKPYSTIAKAYNQTVSTSSINVMNNITQTSTVNLNSNKTITLKSHGNTNSIIRGSSFQDKLLYLTSGKLTMEDITLDGNNVTATSPLIVVNGASASLNTKTKTTLKNNKNTYLYDDNTSNSIKRGGALGVVSGNITIDDIDINNNTEAHSGGGIIQTNGTLNINGGTIQSNTAGYGAGGIYTTNTTGTWQNITIKNNTVTGVKYGDGGAASIYGNSNIQLKSGTISGNSAKRNGAGLTVSDNAKLTITGGSITSNEASGVGGGLMVGDDSSSSTATIYLKGGTIQYNKASGGGGGIYAWGYGTIDYTSGNVFDNTGGSNYKTNNVYLYANGKYTDHQVSSSSPFTFKAPDVYKVASAVNNDYVMGIQGDSSANGTNVRAWSYYGGTSQKWKIYVSEIRDNKSVYTFASQLSGNPHLWVAGNTNTTSGTNVVIYAPHGNTGGFWWIEDASGYRKIRSKGGSNYLNLTGGTAANGTNIQILAGNSSNAQKWKFIGV